MKEAKHSFSTTDFHHTSARHFVSLVSGRMVILTLSDEKMSIALLFKALLYISVNSYSVYLSQMTFDNNHRRIQKPAPFNSLSG